MCDIICGQFIFFYLGGQSVSCKASLAALRLYGYFCDFFCVVLLSENKYDDDDVLVYDFHSWQSHQRSYIGD